MTRKVGLAISVTCAVAGMAQDATKVPQSGNDCVTVNAYTEYAAELTEVVATIIPGHEGLEWLKAMKRCAVGPYVVSGPASGDGRHLLVEQGGKPIVIVEPEQILVLTEGKGLRFAISDSNRDGRYDHVDSYIDGKPSGGEFGAADFDKDGKTDALWFLDERGKKRRLVLLEGLWVELVTGDGQHGWLVRGVVVPSKEEAIRKLRGANAE